MLKKILKYMVSNCSTSQIIQPQLANIARRNSLDLEVITDETIKASPVLKLQDLKDNIYDVCSGGEPKEIIENLQQKIKELS